MKSNGKQLGRGVRAIGYFDWRVIVEGWSRPEGLHDAISDRIEDQFAYGVQSKFAHDIAAMGLGRFHT